MEMSSEMVALGLIWYVAFLFSTTLHEAAHALAAYRLGDSTAYHGGQVTLNPLPHIQREPFGMVLVPILTFALSGWTMGWASAPYDPIWARRHPKRSALMALAGPAANLLVVLAAGVLIRLGLATGLFTFPEMFGFASLVSGNGSGALEGLATFVSVLFSLNLILFTFNLLPLPPLDGSGALPLVLSQKAAEAYMDFMHQPMLSILGILAAWRLFGGIFGPIMAVALQILFIGV